MLRIVFAVCCVLAALGAEASAQSNEVTVAVGGGGIANGSSSGGAFNLSYARNIGDHFAAEGSVETFYVRGDDVGGVQGSVLYHFTPSSGTRTLIPYVTVGVGTASTDFTEIQSDPLVKLGAGIKYHFGDHVGVRFEVRDEITEAAYNVADAPSSGPSHYVGARVGIVFRF